MKTSYVVLGLMGSLLSGCAAPMFGNQGNPDQQPYIGSAGSVWDAAQNPPATIGVVAYNPDVETSPPVGERVQGQSGDTAGMPVSPNAPPTRSRSYP